MLLTIPSVRVLDKLAEGGFSIIYKAQYLPQPDKVFALKVLRPEKVAGDPVAVKAFRNEAKLLHELKHDGLIHVFESGTEPTEYMVMELFAGENLRHMLMKKSDFLRRKWLPIIMSVASTLQYLHANGVIHKDIKPENILVDAELRTKLLDLSIAEKKGGFKMPFSGSRVQGSVSCMSPEQIQGKPLDFKTDIYSLGCVLFELVSGQPVFPGKTPEEVMRRHVKEPPPAIRSLVPAIPPEVDMLLQRMLAKSPAERIDNMNLVLFELRRFQNLKWPFGSASTIRRQRATRIPLTSATVTYVQVEEGDRFRESMQNRSTLVNISQKGIEFRARECLAPNQLLDMLLFVPPFPKPLKARAKVHSCDKVPGEQYYRTVALFVMVDKDFTEKLELLKTTIAPPAG